MTGTDFDDWVNDARAVSIDVPVEPYRSSLKASGAERVGPCPVCKGKDRFSINLDKGLFHCRGSGAGGDVIALTQYLEGCEFRVACEILTGRPPPDRQHGETAEAKAARDAARRARQIEQERRDEAKERAKAQFRERERRACWEIWSRGVSLPGTAADAYLKKRELVAPPNVALRALADHPYYEKLDGRDEPTQIHHGPALLGAIIGPNGRFAGLHTTWIDLGTASGKAEIVHPTTGEVLPAKKVRGLARAGRIPLVRCDMPTGLVIGEGIETVLSVWRALSASRWPHLERTAFWSGYSLGNIGGKAVGTVNHPTDMLTDSLGRQRRRTVAGPVPDFTQPSILIPDSVERIWLLGDGDSDRTLTEMALERGARRFKQQRPGRQVFVAWAPEGGDFNDVLRRAAA